MTEAVTQMEEEQSVESATSRAEKFRALAGKWDARAEQVHDPAAKAQFRRLAELWNNLSLLAGQSGTVEPRPSVTRTSMDDALKLIKLLSKGAGRD